MSRLLLACAVLLILDHASSPAAHVPLADVERAFRAIPASGDQLSIAVDDWMPKPRYRTSVSNRLGIRNHFQGIQRLADRPYVVISGSNPRTPSSDLLILHLNRSDSDDGAIVAKLVVDPIMWHAGGLAMWQDVLAVPIYASEPVGGRIVFYDTRDPEAPRRLPVTIERPGRKAYAVTLTNLPDGRLLLAVFSDRDGRPRRLDFYRSRSDRLEDGFDSEPVSWMAGSVTAKNGQKASFDDFQGIAFVPQQNGKLYLVGFRNTLPSLQFLPGRNLVDLYEIEFPAGTLSAESRRLAAPRLTRIASRQFECRAGYCNMDSAAGLLVNTGTKSLEIYAAAGWVDDERIKFTVYRPGIDTTEGRVFRPGQAR
jgi:hypothetical protein